MRPSIPMMHCWRVARPGPLGQRGVVRGSGGPACGLSSLLRSPAAELLRYLQRHSSLDTHTPPCSSRAPGHPQARRHPGASPQSESPWRSEQERGHGFPQGHPTWPPAHAALRTWRGGCRIAWSGWTSRSSRRTPATPTTDPTTRGLETQRHRQRMRRMRRKRMRRHGDKRRG
ncbi:hypothetical protein EYF80_067837 [Liparis tanakae]|uniref:Uncharacterized protein n=1 Tax=Liparis tanakae TaxID=230148 RepID=A0A4Z2DZZ5_9TELE|nr:hypothetical protein EYF80_067837 [Liparis tanakae]